MSLSQHISHIAIDDIITQFAPEAIILPLETEINGIDGLSNIILHIILWQNDISPYSYVQKYFRNAENCDLFLYENRILGRPKTLRFFHSGVYSREINFYQYEYADLNCEVRIEQPEFLFIIKRNLLIRYDLKEDGKICVQNRYQYPELNLPLAVLNTLQ